MATPEQVAEVIRLTGGRLPAGSGDETRNIISRSIDSGLPPQSIATILTLSGNSGEAAKTLQNAIAIRGADQGARLTQAAPTGYKMVNNGGIITYVKDTAPAAAGAPAAPATPAAPGGDGQLGHWEPLGPGGKLVYIGSDGKVAMDPDTGTPILFNDNGGAVGGGDTGVSASIQAAQQAADRAERQREYDLTYQQGADQFDKTFARDNFNSDRAFEQAKQQYAQTYAENKRQFDVSEGNRLSIANQTEAGANARFGAEYGLNAANAENQYNQSNYQTDVADELNRYNAETNRQSRLSELALQRDAQAREILRNPSDALARLFFQRGGTSPSPFVSQADLLDRLSGQIVAATPPQLPGRISAPAFIRPAPFAAPAQGLTPLTQPAASTGGTTNDAIKNFFANAGGPVAGTVSYDAAQAAGYTPPPPGRYAKGSNGFVRERLSVVGDMPSGSGGNPEAVYNPTNAPIAIEPLSKLSAKGDTESGTEDKAELKAIKAKAAALPHIEDAELAHRMVDDIAAHRGRLSGVPHHALGTFTTTDQNGNWSYSGPTLDFSNPANIPHAAASTTPVGSTYNGTTWGAPRLSQAQQNAIDNPVGSGQLYANPDGSYTRVSDVERQMANSLALAPKTQEQIIQDARDATAPGGQALLSGTTPEDLRFANYKGEQQPLPSAIQYSRLTQGEKENLVPRLAAEYNMTLQDLTDQLQARFGGTRTRQQARLSLR